MPCGLKSVYLITRESTKTVKGEKYGAIFGILYLAPHDSGGFGVDLCPWSTPECRALCLQSSGRMRFNQSATARRARTEFFLFHRDAFLARLDAEISTLVRNATERNLAPMLRLNGTSDLPWELICPDLMLRWKDVVWYDYTKSYRRMEKYLDGRLPDNYYLTFSFDGHNRYRCREVLGRGGTVAVVFHSNLPARWMGYPVLNGDESDIRPWDSPGHVVGLTAKGAARKAPVNTFIVA